MHCPALLSSAQTEMSAVQVSWGYHLAGNQVAGCAAGMRAQTDSTHPGTLTASGWFPIVQVLALTFDDGPVSETALDGIVGVLDVLKAEQVPATFFVNTYGNNFANPKIKVRKHVRPVISHGKGAA